MPKVDAQAGVAGKELRGALPMGTRLRGYELLSVLGQGSFGITYRAHDTVLDRDVAIKEYLPVSLAVRENRATVMARSAALEGEFSWGRDRFLDEARTLAKLNRAPAIVRVHDFLEANGTAYMIMALAAGETLDERLQRGDRLDQTSIERVFNRLLDGLEEVHAAGFLHRDIKPANIILDTMNNPTLIDFGAARMAMAGRTATLTTIFTPGYAAPEQFTSSRQGPWTDIYGLSATLYCAITRKAPPNAFDRLQDDAYEPLGRLRPPGFSPSLLAAIDAGLAIPISHRPQSVAEWRGLLRGQSSVPVSDEATIVMPGPRSEPKRLERSGRGYWILGMALVALAAALVGADMNGLRPLIAEIRTAIHGNPSPPSGSYKNDAVTEAKTAEAMEAGLKLTMIDRRRIQVALTALGFDTYGNDGTFRQRSREMIMAWQKAHNLPATGFLDDAQRQILLKEAASAVSRYDAALKKAGEEKREPRPTMQSGVATPATATPAIVAMPPSAPATAAAPATAFDGSYAGSFIFNPTSASTSASTFVARASITVSNNHGSGPLVFNTSFGSGGGMISIDISSDGNVKGEGEATEPSGIRKKFSIQGHTEDKRIELELKGLGRTPLSMTLRQTSQ
ncbi:MAG: protein kinase [Alphaproteobacteria bacterium]|nr:protein kinase [Alphaproteobacteria bacterium]